VIRELGAELADLWRIATTILVFQGRFDKNILTRLDEGCPGALSFSVKKMKEG